MSVTDERLVEIFAGEYERADLGRCAAHIRLGKWARDTEIVKAAMRRAIAEDRAGEKDKGGHPDCWLCQRGGIAKEGAHRFESGDGVKELACPIEYHPSPKAGTEWRDVQATMGDLDELAFALGVKVNWIRNRAIQRAAESRATGEKG